MRRITSTLFFAGMLATGCASTTSVTRMVGGHRVQGRFIGDEAYAAYLRGVVLETQGQTEAALAAYGDAIRHDPDSAELWTRLGVLRCAERIQPGSPVKTFGPWDAFARASEIDPSYEETWTERARCHLKRGELDEAAHSARVAVALDPDRVEPAVLLSLVLERQGKNDEALRWLDGLVVREPTSTDAHEAMVAFAARTHDELRRQASIDALALLRPSLRAVVKGPGSLADLDAALRRGDYERARKLALAGRVSSGSLALRAAALGVAAFARTQAELVLAADPADSDARVAALVAADLSRDDMAFDRALFILPPDARSSLSPLATQLMGELLRRRIGPDAERAFLRALAPIAKADDPLVDAVGSRR